MKYYKYFEAKLEHCELMSCMVNFRIFYGHAKPAHYRFNSVTSFDKYFKLQHQFIDQVAVRETMT